MKNERKKTDELKEIKLKIEEDFYKEVIDMKYENVMLAEQIELVETENKILKEEVETLKKTSKSYVLKIEKQLKRKDEYDKKQKLI